MPTITLNKNVFEGLVGKKLSLDKLKDRISMLGTDLECIEGNDITVEIFPNRPDLLSEQGFARAFSSFIGVKTGLRRYNVKKSGLKVKIDSSVKMRPYTACAIVKGVNFTDERIREIMQIQEKLALTHGRNRKKSAYGLYPTNNINFPVKYIAKDPKKVIFWPLGMPKPISADKLEEIHPKGIEYKWIAKEWTKYPFFIDNKGNVMSMLPYTNSNDTGKIDESTKEVFIECTGIDFKNVSVALNILVTMLADMGGEIYSLDLEYPDKKITTPNLEPEEMEFDVGYVNKILGLELKETHIKKLLQKMGYDYKKKGNKTTALIPSYRSDILHQIDLVEDIAIAYGYENFKEEIPRVATIGQENKIEKLITKIANLLVGLKLLETNTYHLMSKEELNEKMSLEWPPIELENAPADYNSLRNWMIPSLMKVLSENKHHDYPQKIFEIGTVFKKDDKKETGVKEFKRLAVLSSHIKANYTEAKQILDYLTKALGLEYTVKETEHDSFIPGRVGRVTIDGIEVAFIGEIHPSVLERWGLDVPVCGFELNVTELSKLIDKK